MDTLGLFWIPWIPWDTCGYLGIILDTLDTVGYLGYRGIPLGVPAVYLLDYLGITGGGGDAMPRENKYRRCMKECASPSPPPPPPPPRRRASATVVSDPVGTDQVFEFSYSNRAGLVSIATEPAAQVTCPDTPFPERSSQAAGVSGFTPSRPGVVVDDMCAGSSTSGVLGGGLARQDVGDRPNCSPSPARGGVKPELVGVTISVTPS